MDIELARFNMIEQQIRPWDVLDQTILATFSRVRREQFVPAPMQALAFTDMEIPLNVAGYSSGQHMLAPKVEARFLQALAPKASERCLEIGTGSGYMAALLAHHCAQVTSVERDPKLVAFAQSNLESTGVTNVQVVQGDGSLADRFAGEEFNMLVFSGALHTIPKAFEALLAPGARVISIQGERPVMRAMLGTYNAKTGLVQQVMFETMADSLVGFPVPSHFEF